MRFVPALPSPASLAKQQAPLHVLARSGWGTSRQLLPGPSSPQRWPSVPSASRVVCIPAALARCCRKLPLPPEGLLDVTWSKAGESQQTLLIRVLAG